MDNSEIEFEKTKEAYGKDEFAVDGEDMEDVQDNTSDFDDAEAQDDNEQDDDVDDDDDEEEGDIEQEHDEDDEGGGEDEDGDSKNSEYIGDNLEKSDNEDEDDFDDDSSVEDDAYVFDENLSSNIIERSHTLLKMNNMHEIKSFATIVRDSNGKIIDDYHKTIPILTKYERAKILGIRSTQINSGCLPFIETKEDEIDGYLIAEKELYAKKNPFIIKRPLPNGNNEYWYVNDLELF